MPNDQPTLLVTGFEPFAGSTLNPSQLIAESLADHAEVVALGVALRTALLPVDTLCAGPTIAALWDKHRPDIVLHFGESAKAQHLTLERVAVNLLDFDTPDNAGQHPVDTPIDPAGPAARFVTLPVRALMQRLDEAGIASRLSLSAGAYLCNQVLYLSLGHAERVGGGAAVGFVHVPSLPEQVERGERKGPAMDREDLLNAAARLVALAAEAHRRANRGAGLQPRH